MNHRKLYWIDGMPDVIWIEREEELARAGTGPRATRPRSDSIPSSCARGLSSRGCACCSSRRAETIWCVDALRCGSLEPLVPALTAPAPRKVIHSARQDLEAFYLNVKRVISPVFDTQIAAGCIGLKPQIGYADLVKTLLDVSLAKGQTRTDWSQRPLSAAQLEYAADDVAYLNEIAARLTRAAARARPRTVGDRGLPRAGGPLLYEPDPADAWKRLRSLQQAAAGDAGACQGARRLAREDGAPAQSAARLDPRRRGAIQGRGGLPHDARGARRALSSRRPMSEASPRACSRRCATARGEAMDTAPALDPRPTPEQKALTDRLAAVVDAHAAELGVSAEILATRGELKALAMGERDVPSLAGWRRAEIGENLLEALV